MSKKVLAIVKKGETRFGKQVTKLFEERRAELQERLKRLEHRQKEGWGYRKTWRNGWRVKAHKVRPHWAWLPVKRR
jgi:hypothetical protein